MGITALVRITDAAYSPLDEFLIEIIEDEFSRGKKIK